MFKKAVIGAAVAAMSAWLAACATQPKVMWLRLDGQRTSDNPVLHQQAEVDKTICAGEMQKANVSGVTVANGTIASIVAAQQRSDAVGDVLKGCMAEKGYILVKEEEAEAQRQQLLATAAASRQTAQAPLPKGAR